MSFFITTTPQDKDKAAWVTMWDDYSNIETPHDDILDTTWTRLGDENINPHGIFLYHKKTDALAGFFHYHLHDTTWSTYKRCYVEDAYILPQYRGKGRGFLLMYEELLRRGTAENWQKIHWITRANNLAAQKLYNRFAQKTDWIRYEKNLEEKR